MADAEVSSRGATRDRTVELRFKVFANGRDLGIGDLPLGFAQPSDIFERPVARMDSHDAESRSKIQMNFYF